MCLTWNKQCMAFDNEVKRSNGDWESFRVSAWWWKDEHFARQLVNSPATPITLWYLEGLFCRPKIQGLHNRICVIGVNHESRAIFRSDLLVYIHQSSHSGWDRRERDVYALLLQLLGKKTAALYIFILDAFNQQRDMSNAIVVLVIYGIVSRWKQSVGYRLRQTIRSTDLRNPSLRRISTVLLLASEGTGHILGFHFIKQKSYIHAKFQTIKKSGNPLSIFFFLSPPNLTLT